MGDEEEELPPLPEKYTLTTDSGEKPTSIGFSGEGTAAYMNGDTYKGIFANGIRQGKGVYTYRCGDVFDGCFEDNKKTGLGRMTYKKGGYFHGNFKDGMREGEGTFQYANGDIYSGLWRANKRHGGGTYVFAKTKYAYVGEWMDGQMVKGEWRLTDGTKFVGGFHSQKPLGEGKWITSRGTTVEGAYLQQVLPIDKAPPAPPDGECATTTKTYWKTASLAGVEED